MNALLDRTLHLKASPASRTANTSLRTDNTRPRVPPPLPRLLRPVFVFLERFPRVPAIVFADFLSTISIDTRRESTPRGLSTPRRTVPLSSSRRCRSPSAATTADTGTTSTVETPRSRAFPAVQRERERERDARGQIAKLVFFFFDKIREKERVLGAHKEIEIPRTRVLPASSPPRGFHDASLLLFATTTASSSSSSSDDILSLSLCLLFSSL